MQFHIKHTIRYNYSKQVFCEPLTLRLRPREDALQRLVRYHLSIDPLPAGMNDSVDVEGNSATHCWFNAPTCGLTLVVSSVVETLRANPYDFLLDHGALDLPIQYRPEICAALAPYRVANYTSGPVAEFAQRMSAEVDRKTMAFPSAVALWIFDNCQMVQRPDGDPFSAETTLVQRQGACRDFSVLFIEACRCVGLAARFVSGYQAEEIKFAAADELHAWAEVFLPGGGWLGFDPSQGLAVAEQHVVLATGLAPLAATTITGSFRGTDAFSTMETQVVIRASGSSGSQSQSQSAQLIGAPA
jgi:transglutaminase-like putative cysteine protease